jgi:hypothetical protein
MNMVIEYVRFDVWRSDFLFCRANRNLLDSYNHYNTFYALLKHCFVFTVTLPSSFAIFSSMWAGFGVGGVLCVFGACADFRFVSVAIHGRTKQYFFNKSSTIYTLFSSNCNISVGILIFLL